MRRWKVRIRGTINDEIEVEADDEAGAKEEALSQWRYVEFEDLTADDAYEVES